MKITCQILTFNEEARIANALTHAMKWADEVLVVDKCSTDKTVEIAKSFGARVESIPFSRQGHEDVVSICQLPANDWVWIFTPGEVPSKGVIEAGKAMIGDEVDMVNVPIKMWSFGVHHINSPWGLSLQPRLFHRGRVQIRNEVHANFAALPERTRTIPHSEANFIIHQTHATAQSFIRSHADYMAAEATKPNHAAEYNRALVMCDAFDGNFQSDKSMVKQYLAWKVYWLGVALHHREQMDGATVEAEYHERATQALEQFWKPL